MNKVSHDSETPAHGQQVLTASAFIHQEFDGVIKVLLPRRAQTKKFFPGVYEMPGGHVDFGEDMKLGLAREVKEELGMTVNIGDPFYVFTYLNNIKGSHSIEVIYFAKFIDPIDRIKIEPEDHSEYGWFPEQEVDTVMKIGRKNMDNFESDAIKKGFELLKGDSLNFG